MSDAAFWDRIAPKYAKDPISDQASYAKTLGRMRAILQPRHAVLEIGCGTGSTALELAPGVASYVGTDVSPEMIKIAKDKQFADLPARLRFDVAPADALPDGPFDAILALNLLHLVRDPAHVLRAVSDALPRDGLFIAKTPLIKDGAWFLPPMIKLMRLFGKAPFVNSFSSRELAKMLKSAGFEVIEEIEQGGMAPRIFTVARKAD